MTYTNQRRPAFGARRSAARYPAKYGSPARRGRGPQKDYIDPARFIKAARPVEAVAYTPRNAFSDFAVDDLIKRNIELRGFTEPTPIQDETIPLGLAGRDVIGIANTGTGKTIAFALPMLHALITNPNARALIMAPTRELASQIQDECKWIAKGSGLFGALLIGGAAIGPQLRELRANPRIIIGTPGRIQDHMERGTLDVSKCSVIVLDEVDRMLDMGFVGDMRAILAQVNPLHQSFFFSATFDRKVTDLIKEFSNDPITISVKTGETSDSVEQDVVRYNASSEKIDLLHDLLIKNPGMKALVFDETQRNVERLANELINRGFSADAIHGGKSQAQRQRALDKFKKDNINVLVATDVAARGIDIPDVTHVINYTTPKTYDDYVHRIGRAGRAGKTGHALTFVER
jgi:superfamily II DNA/RNA helicase